MGSSHFACSLIEITRTLPKFECNFSFGHKIQLNKQWINEMQQKINSQIVSESEFFPFENRKQETIIYMTVRKAIIKYQNIRIVVTS